MPATAAELDRLAAAYQAALSRIAAATETLTERTWRAIPGVDAEQVEAWLTRARTGLYAGQDTAAALAAEFIDTYVAAATDGTLPASRPDLDGALEPLRRAGIRDDLYREVARTARQQVSTGIELTVALDDTAAAVGQLADGDVTLAARAGTSAALERHPQVTRFKRQPEPTACPFCRRAAEQTYRRSDLLPIHGHCHCVTVPLVGAAREP